VVDRAVRQKEQIDLFLRQDITEIVHATESWAALADVLGADDGSEVPA
jgi:flagellar biosynthesis/type III secretory pathway ATPase